MSADRRSFLRAILAAPAIVGSGILMPIKVLAVPSQDLYLSWFGHDLGEFDRTRIQKFTLEEIERHFGLRGRRGDLS